MENCEPAEIEALLADELARTESSHWVVQTLEAKQTVWNAKHQLEISNLKTRLEATLNELITYSGAEALGGRVAQELGERVRAALMEVFEAQKDVVQNVPTKQELEMHIDGVKTGVIEGFRRLTADYLETIPAKLRSLEGEAQKSAQATDVMLNEVKTILNAHLQKLVSAEAFEARLMAVGNMLHEANNKALQEATAHLQAVMEKRLSDTLGPLQQRMSSLITFQDWERVTREADQALTTQFGLQISEGQAALVTQQQNFLSGLQRDWELLNKTQEEMRTRMNAQSAMLEEMKQEQSKAKEVVASVPQALQNFERSMENRLRDQAQLYQAEINALHRKMEASLAEAFAKRFKTRKVVAE